MACRWQEEGPVMRNAFVIFHPGRKWISCDFSETLPAAQASPPRDWGRYRLKSTVEWVDDDDDDDDKHFLVLMRPSQRGSISKRLDEDGLAFKRFGRWSEPQCGRPLPSLQSVSVKSKNALCRHLMSLLESDEERPFAGTSLNATTSPQWN